MKNGLNVLLIVLILTIVCSCKKDDAIEMNAQNCYVCSTAAESIDVCEDNGQFTVDGDVVELPSGATLEDYIRTIEANPENDPALEGISCTRK